MDIFDNQTKTYSCFRQIRSPEPNTFPYYIGNYVFPVVFTAGFCGNVLNLIILNRIKKAKSVPFLSAIATVDLCFFLVMFVLNLSVYDSLAVNTTFLNFYYKFKMTLVTLANWFSSTSIWFVVVVTVERLIAIRTPLKARNMWHRKSTALVITFVCVSTMLLQLPHFLWLKPNTIRDCDDPNRTTYILLQLERSHPFYEPLKYAIVVCPIIVVTIPLILLISLNSLLIYHVRLSRLNVSKSGGALNYSQTQKHHCGGNSATETEAKITYTVSVVCFTFFVFNFPSAVVFIYSAYEKNHDKLHNLITPQLITNYMVTLNKALTFPVYICSSSNFRDHFVALTTKTLNVLAARWRKLSLTDTISSVTAGTVLISASKVSRQDSDESADHAASKLIDLHLNDYCPVISSKRTSSESDKSTAVSVYGTNRDCLPLL